MEETKLSFRETLSKQLFLFKFCLKASPGHFIFHIIGSIKVEVFIFLEHIWWIEFNLSAAEEGKPFSGLLMATIGIFILFIFHQLTDSIYNYWSLIKLRPLLYQKFREKIYQKAQQIDLSCYDNPDYYNEFILSSTEADQCIDRFIDDIYHVLRYSTVGILYFGYLWNSNAQSLLMVAASFIFILLSGKGFYGLKVKATLEKNPALRKRSYIHRVFYLSDYAKELRVNDKFNKVLLDDFDECNEDVQKVNHKYGFRLWILNFLQNYIAKDFILYAIYLPWLMWQIIETKSISISSMIILLYVIRRLGNNCNELANMYPKIRMNSIFINKIQEFLNYKPQIISGNVSVEDDLKVLQLSHVNFSYTDNGKPVLHDINMEVKKGQKIALVGYNGAGKSTLVKLLMRLYDPDSGIILRNGVNIKTLDLAGYRNQISAVFQDYKIYAATLRENVVMDLCSMDKKETFEVEKALYKSQFTLKDKKLKYQIETPLTSEFEKDGVNLSGGESQKVAISRTLYRENQLIIMDEPSSALDPLAEYQLNKTLQDIADKNTVIFISHRLSTTRDADIIYMMENGRIIEQGSHSQLLERQGEYEKMWRAQAGKYMC